MLELLTNCKHESDIAVYLERCADGRDYIIKMAMSQNAISYLECELAGYAWYAKRLLTQCKASLRNKKHGWMTIAIEYIMGECGDYKCSLAANRDLLLLGIDHYLNIWPCQKDVPLHGDFSLNNMIFNENEVHLVDWEHFKLSGSPWGFDVLFMLLVNLCGSGFKGSRLREEDFDVLVECFEYLSKGGKLRNDFLKTPLSMTKKFIENNSSMWGLYPAKIPFMNIDDASLLSLDTKLQHRINQKK